MMKFFKKSKIILQIDKISSLGLFDGLSTVTVFFTSLLITKKQSIVIAF